MSNLAGSEIENINVKKYLKIECFYSFLRGESKGHYKSCQTMFSKLARDLNPFIPVLSENVGCVTILMEVVCVKWHHPQELLG